METHLKAIKDIYHHADEADQPKIRSSIRELLDVLEGPTNAIWSKFNVVQELATLRTAIDLDLFTYIADSPGPVSAQQIAEKTGASPVLIARILRFLVSCNFLSQPTRTTYTSHPTSPVARAIASDSEFIRPLLTSGYDWITFTIFAFPAYSRSTNYQAITSPKETAFQYAFKTDLTAFEYLAQPGNEKLFAEFSATMTSLQSDKWVGKLKVLEHAALKAKSDANGHSDHEAPIFVDVAGGLGHQSEHVLKKYPELKGRILLQDRPEVVKEVADRGGIAGVKVMVHDFFEEQSVKGAKFYYMRHIIHDWPDSSSQTILSTLAAAMAPESRILIDDIVLPDSNVNEQAAMRDLALMLHFGGAERSRQEWRELVDGVVDEQGRQLLEIEDVVAYDYELHESITVVKLK